MLIRTYKMSERHTLASFWAEKLYGIIVKRWPEYVLVPVPPRPEKRKTHAWDQVEAIASKLEVTGIPVARPLVRIASAEQKLLGRESRKTNAEKGYAFDPLYRETLPSKVVLFDDIYTTGATAEACTLALKANGAQNVSVLVLAMD
jgi:predicted amidophosphoribosyltransferase